MLRSDDGDWAEITICAFASRERDFRDLGRGILCSQGFGKPPLLVGLVTKMADKSNGDRFPLSITLPIVFLTVGTSQMKVDANEKTKLKELLMHDEDAREAMYRNHDKDARNRSHSGGKKTTTMTSKDAGRIKVYEGEEVFELLILPRMLFLSG